MTVNNTMNTISGESESWGTRGFTAAGVQRSKDFKIMICEHLSDAEYELLELCRITIHVLHIENIKSEIPL